MKDENGSRRNEYGTRDHRSAENCSEGKEKRLQDKDGRGRWMKRRMEEEGDVSA